MITYGDLFPYRGITLADLVNSAFIDEEDALQIAGLGERNSEVNEILGVKKLFGDELHKIISKKPNRMNHALGDLFKSVGKSYMEFLRLMSNYLLSDEMLEKRPDMKLKLGRYVRFNEDLYKEMPSFSFFKRRAEKALKRYNLTLNPFFVGSSEHKIIEEYQITLITLFESEDKDLLNELQQELKWINVELFQEADEFLPLIRTPKALVHYYREFGEFVDKYPVIIGNLVEHNQFSYN